MCVVNGADLNGDQAQIGAVCNSSTCPFASAGGVCNYTLGGALKVHTVLVMLIGVTGAGLQLK